MENQNLNFLLMFGNAFDDMEENLKKCSYSLPTIPSCLDAIFENFPSMLPQRSTKIQFENRPPSLGLSKPDIDIIRKHVYHPLYEPEQRSLLFRLLRRCMLLMLIPCSEQSSINCLLDTLEDELNSKVPSKVPRWYWKNVGDSTLHSQKIGYMSCSNDGCLKTEDLETTFQRCSLCKATPYCKKSCQVQHWKSSHKKTCDNQAIFRRRASSREAFFEMNTGIPMKQLDKNSLLFYRSLKNNTSDVLKAIGDDPNGKWNKR